MKTRRMLAQMILLLVFVILPTLYVLSAGPYVWFQSRGRIGSRAATALEVVYLPLGWAYSDHILHDPLEAYLKPWRAKPARALPRRLRPTPAPPADSMSGERR